MAHILIPASKKNAPPWEYILLQLCRDIYHCRPSELMEEDWDMIDMHLFLMGVESEAQQMKKELEDGMKKGKTSTGKGKTSN